MPWTENVGSAPYSKKVTSVPARLAMVTESLTVSPGRSSKMKFLSFILLG